MGLLVAPLTNGLNTQQCGNPLLSFISFPKRTNSDCITRKFRIKDQKTVWAKLVDAASCFELGADGQTGLDLVMH